MDKKYLNKRGLATLLGLIKFGHKKIWHGTLAEWEALSAEEKAKYDQAEVIDEYTGVPVVVDKVEAGNMNAVTSNAVYEDGDLSEYVDISSTVENITNNDYELNGTPILRYKKLGRHFMFLDARFSIKYKTAVSAGVERQEDYFKFKIPAVLTHGDSFVNMTGYTRGSAGIVNPIVQVGAVEGGMANLSMITKVWHNDAKAVNATEDFNFNGIIMVDKWLS